MHIYMVHTHTQEGPLFPSALGDGPSIEKMLRELDMGIALDEAQQEATTSKIEKLQGMILQVLCV